MIDENIELIRKNRLAKEIVFADGIGSSGKGMLSHFIASFERIEKQSNDMIFDTIPRIHDLGKITNDAAIALMQIEADQRLYHSMMSREVNFRPTDSTGVTKNPFPFKYFKRLFMAEGDNVIERIKKEKPILNEAPHDALKNCELLFNCFQDTLKIIYIVRSPTELVYDWEIRGFGDRIGKDPREFQFSYMYDDKIVPLYAQGWENQYMELSSTDRNIMMIKHHYYNNINAYMNLESCYKKNVKIINFDELVSKPEEVCEKIAEFLGTKTTKWTKKIINKEGCPRIIKKDYENKIKYIQNNSTKLYLDCLNEMEEHYINNFVGE